MARRRLARPVWHEREQPGDQRLAVAGKRRAKRKSYRVRTKRRRSGAGRRGDPAVGRPTTTAVDADRSELTRTTRMTADETGADAATGRKRRSTDEAEAAEADGGRRMSQRPRPAMLRRDATRAPGRPERAQADPAAEFGRQLRMLPGDWYVVHSYAGVREPGQGEPGEPHPVAEHGGLHLPDRGAGPPGHRDQGRQAPAGRGEGAARLHPGPDGPDRPVLGRGAQHPGRDRLRRAVQQAVAAQPGRGRLAARSRARGAGQGDGGQARRRGIRSRAIPLPSWMGRSPPCRRR